MEFLFRLLPPARWRLICLGLLIFAIVLCFLSYSADSLAMQNGAVICVSLAIGGNLGFWRCPRCRRILPWKNMLHISHCPHCRSDVRNFKY